MRKKTRLPRRARAKEGQELLRNAGQPFGQHAVEVSWLSVRSPGPGYAVPISGQEVGLAVVWHRAICSDRFSYYAYDLFASHTVRDNRYFHFFKTSLMCKELGNNGAV